jgi:2-iminobutanoate/2-iminopropanoate deaminase
MKKIVISSENAPKAVGPYSQAILTNSQYKLELSGQIGLDPEEGSLVEGGLATQTKQTLDNIGNVLSELGWDFNNITKVRVFLVSMGDYGEVNEIYSKRFDSNPPARVAVAVKDLPLGALIEIECSAEGDEVSEQAKEKYNIA